MDRRIARTKQTLLMALISLLNNERWEQINVQKICAQADIARSTFYTHFNNKQELLNFGFGRLEGELKSEQPDRGLNGFDTFGFLPELLDHVLSYSTVFSNLLQSPNTPLVLGRFRGIIESCAHREIQNSKFAKTIGEKEIAFLAGGIFGIFNNWVHSNCNMPILDVLNTIDNLVRAVLHRYSL